MVIEKSLTIPKMVLNKVKEYPQIVAQSYRGADGNFKPITYLEMFEISMDFAAALLNLGVKREQPIGIISDNRPEWQQADIGLLSIGAVDVPRGCDATLIDLEKILGITECEIVIVENYAQASKIVELKDKLPHIKKLISFDQITKDDVLQNIKKSELDLLYFQDLIVEGKKWRAENHGIIEAEIEKGNGEDLATIIFTSGTTGTPKGVMLTHHNFLIQLEELVERIYGNPGEKALSVLPIWHVFERECEYVMIIQAITIVYSKPIGSVLLSDFQKTNPQILPAVPRVFEAVYDGIFKKMRKTGGIIFKMFSFFVKVAKIHKRMQRKMFNKNPCYTHYHPVFWWAVCLIPWTLMWPLYLLGDALVFKKIKAMLGNGFRAGIAGGGSFPEYIDEFFWALGVNVVEGYGLTETAPVISVRPVADPIFGTIGSPIRHIQARIVDQEGYVLGRCKVGELQIKGPTVMKGYYKNPEKTAEVFTVDGWLKTGDLAIFTIHNELKIKGRIKDTIVLLGGENLEPVPIEEKLNESRFVKQSVVIGQDRRYLTVLILVDEEEVKGFAATNGIFYDTYESLLENEEIKRLYETEIAERINVKNGFKIFERINRFALITKPFEVGVELSAKQEIMRHRISELYSKKIEEMYKE